jgi:hypothetical protein
MRNLFLGAIVVGALALIAGIVLLLMKHHLSAYGGIAVGVILLIGGIVALFTSKGKSVSENAG